MMKKLIFIMCIINCSLNAQNTVCFNIEANPSTNDPALSIFTKYIRVLNCFDIYAEETISDAKVLYAAAIAAELLDNNEDGFVDDLALKSQLASSKALIPLLASEGSDAENALFDNYNGEGISAVLYNNEINPNLPGLWGYDATVEEILHTINHVGHTNIYPNAFGLTPNSSLMSTAMDVARGGQFLDIPNTYPDEAWYHYDDYTCDYECMAIEYMYWAIVSNMGILNDPNTCAGIANEWEACSPELFQNMDILMYDLITTPQYMLPQNAPDGNYCPESIGLNQHDELNLRINPNPCVNSFNYTSTKESVVYIYKIDGSLVFSTPVRQGNNTIKVSSLSKGFYLIKDDINSTKLIIQ